MEVSKVYILAGGNLGNSREIISQAREKLANRGVAFVSISAFYQSEAWAMDHSPDFINQAWHVHTSLAPQAFLALLQQMESQYPRQRSAQRYFNRHLDLDILYYNNDIISTPQLKVPHPKIYERRFALLPLCEIAPQLKDPITGQSVEQHLQQCSDNGKVSKV